MNESDDYLPISALNDLLFCERRCALHRIENVWVDNVYTLSGTYSHERADRQVTWEIGSGVRAVHGLLLDKDSRDGNVFVTPGYALDASGNLISCPGKIAALIGVHDLIVVDTPDALLVCPRDRAQDVGKIVKWLEEQRRKDLL